MLAIVAQVATYAQYLPWAGELSRIDPCAGKALTSSLDSILSTARICPVRRKVQVACINPCFHLIVLDIRNELRSYTLRSFGEGIADSRCKGRLHWLAPIQNSILGTSCTIYGALMPIEINEV